MGVPLLRQALAGCWNKFTPSEREVPTQDGERGTEKSWEALPERSPGPTASGVLDLLLIVPWLIVSVPGAEAPERRAEPQQGTGPPWLGFAERTRMGGGAEELPAIKGRSPGRP